METQNKTQKTLYWNYMCELKKEIIATPEKVEQSRIHKPSHMMTQEDWQKNVAINNVALEAIVKKFQAYNEAQSNYIRLLKKELKEKVV